MNKDLNREIPNRFEYHFYDYVKRFLWRFMYLLFWNMLPNRICWHRNSLLRLFGAQVGKPTGHCRFSNIQMPWNYEIGNYCSIGPNVRIYNLGKVEIGDWTVVSQDAYICAGTHDYTHPRMPLQKESIRIGNSVWICAGAFVGPGVTIGDGAVVGARAVVTKDVEPWTVVGGNPAKLIKKRELKKDISVYFSTHSDTQ